MARRRFPLGEVGRGVMGVLEDEALGFTGAFRVLFDNQEGWGF